MTVQLAKPGRGSVPVHAVDSAHFKTLSTSLAPAARRWLETCHFVGAPDTHALLPAPDGSLQAVWAGVHRADDPWALAALPKALPVGNYHLADNVTDSGMQLDTAAAALSWELGSYSFDLYKPRRREPAALHLPPSNTAKRALIVAAAIAS